MGSDRARVSFDAARQWRGVVAQQGRVALEADSNEAQAIAAEANRAQLLDVVGPQGTTPDDGYRIAPAPASAAAGDFMVRQGTMYVGGVRVHLDADLQFSSQGNGDWAEQPTESAAADQPPQTLPPATSTQAPNELIYLLLREHEVSAVEDPTLREVALGGPDTAQRTRIVQRVLRHATATTTCAAAWSELGVSWSNAGYAPNATTLRLESSARLQAFFDDVTAPSACEPEAQGGYLGAENQLIRVQICGFDQAGTPLLAWGYDNASYLYRISSATANATASTTTLTLDNRPPDGYHQPQPGQVVEVLRTAAVLEPPNPQNDEPQAAVASATGIVTTIAPTGGYNPDTKTVAISTALTAPYNTVDNPVLYLRVWQGQVTAIPGTLVALGDTGLTVKLTSPQPSPAHFHVGDHWLLAVRPSTPAQVYPRRFLDAPQPPDGPPLWACPLAVVQWTDPTAPTIVDDARGPFLNLVELTKNRGANGCCTLDIGPADVHGGAALMALVDSVAAAGNVTICLKPGTYTLPGPLVLGPNLTSLTLDGGDGAALLEPDPNAAPNTFLDGMIVANGSVGLVLRGLNIKMPDSAPITLPQSFISTFSAQLGNLLSNVFPSFNLSIGVHAVDAVSLTLENCTFNFPAGSTTRLAAGIFSDSGLQQARVRNCGFYGNVPETLPFADLAATLAYNVQAGMSPHPTTGPYPVHIGLLQMPVKVTAGQAVATPTGTNPVTNTTFTQPQTSDIEITGNLFDGLTVATLTLGDLGLVRVAENTVRGCYGGFWSLITPDAAADLSSYQSPNLSPFPAYLTDAVIMLVSAAGNTLTYAAPSAAPQPTTGGPTPVQPFTATPPQVSARIPIPFPIPVPIVPPVFVPPDYGGPQSDDGRGLVPKLEFRANQVDAVLAHSYSGAGLMLARPYPDVVAPSSLVLAGNRIRGRVPNGATALLVMLSQSTITGNVVSNEVVEVSVELDRMHPVYATSLSLEPKPNAPVLTGDVITGNVFVSSPWLPPRTGIPMPTAPGASTDAGLAAWAQTTMDWLENTAMKWEFFNTVVPPLTPNFGGPLRIPTGLLSQAVGAPTAESAIAEAAARITEPPQAPDQRSSP